MTEEQITFRGEPATRVRGDKSWQCAVYIDGCPYCEREKEAGEFFFPNHHASSRCESGGHNHCTCDTCF